MQRISIVFGLLCIFCCVPFHSFAQLNNTTLSLELSPAFPEAEEAFTAKLNSLPTDQSAISWILDGKEDIASKNKSSISLRAPSIGKNVKIVGRVTRTDGSTVEQTYTLTPNRVDLFISTDTIAPAFYKGHKLPSSGSVVTATALLFSANTKGPESYLYTWTLDGKVQNGGAVQGGNKISFTPSFNDKVAITLTIQESNGKTIARTTDVIPIVQPELYFYEKNPLRGLSFTAMQNPFIFIGEEILVRAEGYYMSQQLLTANILQQWSIDGQTVVQEGVDPNEILLRKNGSDATANVSFHIRNLQQLLQGVKKSITIQF